MKSLVVVLAFFVVYSQAISYKVIVEELWQNFKAEYGKYYESEREEEQRRNIYMDNLHKINEHNKLYAQGLVTYNMAINQFGDLTEEDFLRLYTTQEPSSLLDIEDELPESMKDFFIIAPYSDVNVTTLSEEINWKAKGAVTPVKNQGSCGSCWSFATTGVLESHLYIKTKKLVSLSEQNLMDCSWKYGNNACHGGLAKFGLQYVKDNGGIDTESSYGYKGHDSKACKFNSKNKVAIKISNIVSVPQDEKQLQIKVAKAGPMAVSITPSGKWQHYNGGILDDPNCGQSLGHAVLVVGYGSQGGHDYWLVKNSWGASWGDKGYIKMSRNKNNQCGITKRIVYPVL